MAVPPPLPGSPSTGAIPARRAPAGGESSGVMGGVERFKALPRPVQIVVGLAFVGFVYLAFSGRGGDVSAPTEATNLTTPDALRGGQGEVFAGLETDRPALMQSWLEQNRREMSSLNEKIEERFVQRDQALTEALQQNAELQRQMRQMMTDFTSEIRSIQSESAQDREMLDQLAEEQRRMQLDAPVDGTSGQGAINTRRTRIEQTPLGSAGGGPAVDGSNALLAPFGRALKEEGYAADTLRAATGQVVTQKQNNPFLPPLGFIHGTLLNGVDALVGGQSTPALVRLQGQYKTAMNSTVNLDGCFALVEFQGEISTERAIGKPSRMTCVYPDQGAVTYSISGYVVDSEDGIIGIPGIFYEGDATRIATAMLADFAVGVAEIIKENQASISVDSEGNATQTVTGDELKGEIAGGTSKAMGSLRDYLLERVNRVLPFIRLDTTREINLVLLSGVELRAEGSPWTLLFDGTAAKAAQPAEGGALSNGNKTQAKTSL
ncbi:MAG: hypothetical protein COY40_06110 [Alphaproteobacteria bacterium CG_4_10_14_0_8_um_filter_53_9]|nr:MAG: hypothetical protein COY40_06110 [Alphaproteobacteria bacterium CG_4_10_14_0_8_um_filter_53_9]